MLEETLKRCERVHIGSNMNKRLIFSTVATVGYMALIFWLSSLPGNLPPEIEVLEVPRTLVHVGEYAILGFLMDLVAMGISSKASKSIFYSSVFSSVYGVTDEIHQHFVPTRCFDIHDMYADTIGGILGAVSLTILLTLTGRKTSAGQTEGTH